MVQHVACVCAYILLRRQPPLTTGSADISILIGIELYRQRFCLAKARLFSPGEGRRGGIGQGIEADPHRWHSGGRRGADGGHGGQCAFNVSKEDEWRFDVWKLRGC